MATPYTHKKALLLRGFLNTGYFLTKNFSFVGDSELLIS
jgi:hypothetical protein